MNVKFDNYLGFAVGELTFLDILQQSQGLLKESGLPDSTREASGKPKLVHLLMFYVHRHVLVDVEAFAGTGAHPTVNCACPRCGAGSQVFPAAQSVWPLH